jgi:CRP-like cAMP-binding protein
MGARAVAFSDREMTHEEDTMKRLLALQQVPLFEHLSLEQLDAVLRVTREEDFQDGEVICREGDPGGVLYLIVEGSVRIYKSHGTPAEHLLSTIAAVSYFGEMAILDDEPRSATAVAAGGCRVLCLDGASLKELILQMPQISFEIFRVLTSRVRAAEARLGDR